MSEHMRKARAAVPGLSEALRSIDDVERSSDTPDAQEPQVRCNNCGAALPARRKPKSFCNYACRGQFQVVKATGHRTGLIGSKNTKQAEVNIGTFRIILRTQQGKNHHVKQPAVGFNLSAGRTDRRRPIGGYGPPGFLWVER